MISKNKMNGLLLFCIVLALDSLWLSLMKHNYNALVRTMQGSDIQIAYIPALLSYMCVFLALYVFAIPRIQGQLTDTMSILDIFKVCLIYGGGLGISIYGVFNFTNMAIFNKYRHWILYADTLWGGILFTLTTFMYFMFYPIQKHI